MKADKASQGCGEQQTTPALVETNKQTVPSKSDAKEGELSYESGDGSVAPFLSTDLVTLLCTTRSIDDDEAVPETISVIVPLMNLQVACQAFATDVVPYLVSVGKQSPTKSLNVHCENRQALTVFLQCCQMQESVSMSTIDDCWDLIELAKRYGLRSALDVAIVSLCNLLDAPPEKDKEGKVPPNHLFSTWLLYDELALLSPFKALLGRTLYRYWTAWLGPPFLVEEEFTLTTIHNLLQEQDEDLEAISVECMFRFLDFHKSAMKNKGKQS